MKGLETSNWEKCNTHCEICRYIMLLVKEETVLQGMIERPNGTGRCCEMEMNVDRKWESQDNHPKYRLWWIKSNQRMWNFQISVAF